MPSNITSKNKEFVLNHLSHTMDSISLLIAKIKNVPTHLSKFLDILMLKPNHLMLLDLLVTNNQFPLVLVLLVAGNLTKEES